MSLIFLVLIYPLVMFFIPEPVGFKWAFKNKAKILPPHILRIVERNGRIHYFFQMSILAAILAMWIKKVGIPIYEIGLRIEGWSHACLGGILGATLLVLGRVIYVGRMVRIKQNLAEHPFFRGPQGVWLVSFLLGGIVEELWRGYSIVSLEAADFGSILCIAITSTAFLFAHLSGIPSRTSHLREEGLWELLFGAMLGGLFLAFRNLAAPYTAGLLFNISNLYLTRYFTRRHAQPLGSL